MIKKQKKRLFSVYFLLFFIIIISAINIYAQKNKTQKILILFNFGDYIQWNEDFVSSFRLTLKEISDSNILYYVQYLDIGNDQPENSPNYNDAVKLVSRHQYDLVIPILSTAGRFAKNLENNSFKDVPILYILAENTRVDEAKTNPQISVILSASGTAIKNTIDSIESLFPDNSGIVFISGSSILDAGYTSMAKNLVSEKKIDAEFIIGTPVDNIIDILNKKSKEKVLFFLTYSLDSNGKEYLSDDVIKKISSQVDRPIFGFIDSHIDKGIVGGNLTSAKYYGEQAAYKAVEILGINGKKFQNANSTRYVFNWSLLRKYNILEGNLPDGSIIVNKHESLIKKYLVYLIGGSVIVVIQLLLLVIVSISRSKLKRAESYLKSERDFNKSINKTSPIGITTVDKNGKITFANKEAEKILGLVPSLIKNKLYNDKEWGITAYDGSPFPEEELPFNQVKTKKTSVYNVKHAIEINNGKRKLLTINASPVLDDDGSFQGMLSVIQDSTDDVLRKETIKKSLKEKETLLRELYHRTKNNMQTICSLLNLQSRYSNSEEVKEQLQEASNRITSMALVHNKLYQSSDLSNIPIKDYIEDLVSLIRDSYHTLALNVSFDVDVEDFVVEIDTAINIGLIVNELISNAFKHAFPNGSGTITIRMSHKDCRSIYILVKDDGIGVAKDFDFFHTHSLGLKTITNIVQSRSGGVIDFDVKHGLSCEIRFDYPPDDE